MLRKTLSLAAALLFFAPMMARAATITGQLGAAGAQNYKIAAVARDSRTTLASVRANGKFSIAAPKFATLHVVSANGRYVGPIVAVSGRTAFSQLSGRAGNVGRIVLRRASYGTAAASGRVKKLFNRSLVLPYSAATGPRGAGKFGLAQSQSTVRSGAVSEKAIGEDSDVDGLPDVLDVDDDGDLQLDITDQVPHQPAEFTTEITSALRLSFVDSLNANAPGLNEGYIDELIQDNLILGFSVWNNTNGAKTITSVDIDCSTLSYCAKGGGTATVRMDGAPVAEDSPWSNYDPNGNGFPNLVLLTNGPIAARMGVRPNAVRSELRTGDTIFFRIGTSAGATTVTGVLPFFFMTGPTVKEYRNGGVTTTVDYPAAPTTPGAQGYPIQLTEGSIGLTFWKPQRNAIEGAEAPGFVDIGHLSYSAVLAVQGDSAVYVCNQSSDYSDIAGLVPAAPPASGLRDPANDARANSETTLAFTVNLAQCLSRQGVEHSQKLVMVGLTARSDRMDEASQNIFVQMP